MPHPKALSKPLLTALNSISLYMTFEWETPALSNIIVHDALGVDRGCPVLIYSVLLPVDSSGWRTEYLEKDYVEGKADELRSSYS